jgi:hypothetical protein
MRAGAAAADCWRAPDCAAAGVAVSLLVRALLLLFVCIITNCAPLSHDDSSWLSDSGQRAHTSLSAHALSLALRLVAAALLHQK